MLSLSYAVELHLITTTIFNPAATISIDINGVLAADVDGIMLMHMLEGLC